MPIKIQKLSQRDLGPLRAYLESSFCSEGIVILSEDEGVPISVDYKDGVIADTAALSKIKGIPKTVKTEYTGALQFQVSMSTKNFSELNEKYFSDRLPTFQSIEKLVQEYLPLIQAGKKLEGKEFYARLKPNLKDKENPWYMLLKFINFGIHVPEHMEILYGDSDTQFENLLSTLRYLDKRKRYGKSPVEWVWIKPLSGQGHLLRVKL